LCFDLSPIEKQANKTVHTEQQTGGTWICQHKRKKLSNKGGRFAEQIKYFNTRAKQSNIKNETKNKKKSIN
jgi:hypothetical protein